MCYFGSEWGTEAEDAWIGELVVSDAFLFEFMSGMAWRRQMKLLTLEFLF